MAAKTKLGLGLVLVVSGVSTWGCAQPAPPKAAPTRPAEDPAPTREPMFTCEAKLNPTQLALHLSFTNQTGHAVWLAADLPVPSGSGVKADPAAAYVLKEEGGAVVSRRLVVVPEDLEVESPETPGWVRVENHGHYSGTIVVPWPLMERAPYARNQRGGEALPAGKLYCELGYLPADTPQPPRYSDGLGAQQQRVRTEITLPR